MQSMFWITGSFRRASYVRWTFGSVCLWELARFRPFTWNATYECQVRRLFSKMFLLAPPIHTLGERTPVLCDPRLQPVMRIAWSMSENKNIGRTVCAAYQRMNFWNWSATKPRRDLELGLLNILRWFFMNIFNGPGGKSTKLWLKFLLEKLWFCDHCECLSSLRRFQDKQLCRLHFLRGVSCWDETWANCSDGWIILRWPSTSAFVCPAGLGRLGASCRSALAWI